MDKTLNIELVTPEKVALETTADSVILPAFEGLMGVQPGHEPFMVQLQSGPIKIRKGSEEEHFAVSGGFAEILDDKVAIFAETAELADDVDEERAKQALERAKNEAKTGDRGGDLTLAQAEAALKRAQVRLKIANMRKRRTSTRGRAPETDI